jgi:hypothetical protein
VRIRFENIRYIQSSGVYVTETWTDGIIRLKIAAKWKTCKWEFKYRPVGREREVDYWKGRETEQARPQAVRRRMVLEIYR